MTRGYWCFMCGVDLDERGHCPCCPKPCRTAHEFVNRLFGAHDKREANGISPEAAPASVRAEVDNG